MKILVIAYQFCPKGQIGTRRWSKFAKYLAAKGYEVHVICAEYPKKDSINWCQDVEDNPKIIIHRIDGKFPTSLLSINRTFKIKLFDRIRKHSTHYLDIAQQWGRVFIPFTKKLIEKEEITNVIVTAAPFTPMIFMAQIKEQIPHLNLIFDIRDPWEYYLKGEFAAFDRWRKKIALKNEDFAFSKADTILYVSDPAKKEYAERHPNWKDKFGVVYNGFDKDDFKNTSRELLNNFKMVYLGSMISGRMEALIELTYAIEALDDEFINENLVVDLYSTNFVRPTLENEKLQAIFDKHFQLQEIVPVSEVPNVLAKYEYCLSINAKDYPSAFGVKTFDYMGLNKKIVLIAPEGGLPQVLRASNQYVADYKIEELKALLLRMKADSINQIHITSKEYEQFELNNLTEKVIQYLK
ncbi:MAG: glycosyltransferase [Saprospiraceae bacterium]